MFSGRGGHAVLMKASVEPACRREFVDRSARLQVGVFLCQRRRHAGVTLSGFGSGGPIEKAGAEEPVEADDDEDGDEMN